jgi:uncharacterized SAM-binding protein YcdF (DUF218 family)
MNIDFYAKKIWEYMKLHHELKSADLIFVLGSHDIRTAERAAEIYLQGFAPLVVCSGNHGKYIDFKETEARVFLNRMIELGVPKEKVLLEERSTNTGENILYTKELLKQKGIEVKNIIAVQKPYMERRTYATIKKQWPEVSCSVASLKVGYEEYLEEIESKDRFINTMVGDLLRIREYPKLGFQIEQEIPDDVWEAGQELIKMGYDKYLIK